jgi:hypothetical protein
MRFNVIIEKERKQITIIPEDEGDMVVIKILRALPRDTKITTHFGLYVNTEGGWIREGAGQDAFMIVFDPPDPDVKPVPMPIHEEIREMGKAMGGPGVMLMQEEEKPAFIRRIME